MKSTVEKAGLLFPSWTHQVHNYLSCLSSCQFNGLHIALYCSIDTFPSLFPSFSFFLSSCLFLDGAECVVMVIPICPRCECVMSYWWDSVTVCQRHPSCLLNSTHTYAHTHTHSHTYIVFASHAEQLTSVTFAGQRTYMHIHTQTHIRAFTLLGVNMLDSSHLHKIEGTHTHWLINLN